MPGPDLVRRRRCAARFVLAAALASSALPAGAREEPRAIVGTGSPVSAAPLRGIVKSLRQAAFSTELTAPVAAVLRREGEAFEAGEILLRFDCGRQAQELAALMAIEREARVAVDASQYLMRRGASNRNDVEVAQARHDKARAETGAMQQRMRSCEIAAPFAGTVVELQINTHELPVPGKPFMVVVAHRQLELEIIVPSRMLTALAQEHVFRFTADETRRTYGARIRRIAGVVDAMSQMVKIYAEIEDRDDSLLPGMSGTAYFDATTER